jgi:lactam utilization protein B
MSTYIDINCDMGESYGRWTLGHDEDVMPHITSANIACGFHGGDPHVMRKTVELAVAHGVAVGAHPGLPDLMGFGRRRMEVTPDELKDYHRYQVGALWAFAKAAGVPLQHVKAHGIQYHMFEENLPLRASLTASTPTTGSSCRASSARTRSSATPPRPRIRPCAWSWRARSGPSRAR